MKRFLFLIAIAFFLSGISCGTNDKKADETIVSIKTEFGEIKVKLYDDTPKHKANFMKLVNEGFYNDLLFHRVIKNFMIQGGDPNSKSAETNVILGTGGPGYTVPAEINPAHFHKKGALAAARIGGSRNPEKNSSGSQFYIVHGEVYRPGELDTMIVQINAQRKDMLMREHIEAVNGRLIALKEKNDRDGFNLLVAEIREKADSIYDAGKKFDLSPEQREAYSTIGGYPSLDGEYTVFGEVVEGMDVIDKIAAIETNKSNRPVNDVRMQVELVNKK